MTEEEISKWAKKLIHRYDNIKVIGAGGEWSGDARQGFMFNPRPSTIGTGTAPTVTGACCFPDGSCSVVTQSVCEAGGGIYQGDGTPCVPNPCAACCDISGQMKILVGMTVSLTVDDTRTPGLGTGPCALHFNDTFSHSAIFCATPDDWEADFNKTYTCNEPGCNRTLNPNPSTCTTGSGDALISGSELQVRVLGGNPGPPSLIGANVSFNFVCRWQFIPSCIDCASDEGDCGGSDGSFQFQLISDPTHPEGTYVMSDSFSTTDYSWSWSITITIDLICPAT